MASLVGKVVRFQHRRPTDELYPFTKGSETGLGYKTDSTALHSGMRQVSIFVNGTSVMTFKTELGPMGSSKNIFLRGVHHYARQSRKLYSPGRSQPKGTHG